MKTKTFISDYLNKYINNDEEYKTEFSAKIAIKIIPDFYTGSFYYMYNNWMFEKLL